jgi:hypothetical protein
MIIEKKAPSFHKITSISKGNSGISRTSAALANDHIINVLLDNLKAELAAPRNPKKFLISDDDLSIINRFICAEIWRILGEDNPFARNSSSNDVGVVFGLSYSVSGACKTSQFVINIDDVLYDINVNARVAFPNGNYTSWSLAKLIPATHLDFVSQYWD